MSGRKGKRRGRKKHARKHRRSPSKSSDDSFSESTSSGDSDSGMDIPTKQESREFKRFLQHLSDNLLDDDLEKMKMFLKESVGESILRKCTCAQHIFREMRKRGHLSEGKIDNLLELLKDIRRIDLSNEVEEYGREHPYCHSQSTDRFAEIRDHLQKLYFNRLSKLKPYPFCELLEIDLEHVFTNLEVIRGKKRTVPPPVEEEMPIHSVEDLTEILWNTKDRNVCLIEGGPGVGKSTLCRRLAYLWSQGDNKICESTFDIVFLLEARSLKEDLEASIKQIFPTNFRVGKATISAILEKSELKKLVIIDGLDELTEDCKTVVLDLLLGNNAQDPNIILTCRPEASRQFVGYAEKHLKITGFTLENTKLYVRKFFGTNHLESMEKLLNRFVVDVDLCLLAENPFMTCLLCVLVLNGRDDIPSDSNGIIMELIKTTCKLYMSKTGQQSSNIGEDELLLAASKVAYFGISNDTLEFTNSQLYALLGREIGEHLLRSGIVNRDYTILGLDIRDCCYFPHKSIQDFLCAWYLAQLIPDEFEAKVSDLPRKIVFGKYWDMYKRLTELVIDNLPMAKVLISHLAPLVQSAGGAEKLVELLLRAVNNLDVLDPIAEAAMYYHHVFNSVCRYADRVEQNRPISHILMKMTFMPCVLTAFDDGLDPFFHVFKYMPYMPYLNVFEALQERISQCFERLIFTWIVCFDVDAALRILDYPLTVHTLSLILLPGQFTFAELHSLMNRLESTKKNMRLFVIVYKSPHDDYMYLKIMSCFRSLKNSNILVNLTNIRYSQYDSNSFKTSINDRIPPSSKGIFALFTSSRFGHNPLYTVLRRFYDRYSPL